MLKEIKYKLNYNNANQNMDYEVKEEGMPTYEQ